MERDDCNPSPDNKGRTGMKNLRQAIRKIILEGLRFEEDLMILNHPKSPTLYLLCDAQWEHCMHGSTFDKERFYHHNVLAMIQVKSTKDPCNGAVEVKKAASVEGYGPTLYDCVMELTDGIINDRDSVSGDAKRVMQRYKDTRPDVEKKLLDNMYDYEMYPVTPETADDCSPGDSAEYEGGIEIYKGIQYEDDPLSYSYNKELSPTTRNWVSYGNEFLNKLEANGDLFYTDLRRWGRAMFDTAGL